MHFVLSISPMILIFVGGVASLIIPAFQRHAPHMPRTVATISLTSLAAAFLVSWYLWIEGAPLATGMLTVDRVTLIAWLIVFLAAGFVVLLSTSYLPERSRVRTEYYALLLFAALGMATLTAATDLVSMIIGIEMTALSSYILVGSLRFRLPCNEASIKYFLVGSFALAFFVMGLAFIFGSTGTTDLATIGQRAGEVLASERRWFFLLGCALFLVGFAFKIAAVPFHAWAPDVYEGAPTPITAFIAGAVKVAAFIALMRLAQAVFGQAGTPWIAVSAGLAIATMLVGNLAAIVQENIKRLLAYSSIAHAGYVLVAFPAFATDAKATTAILFYLIAYAFMTLGAFAVVIALSEGQEEHNNITALAGLGRNRPGMAAALAFFLISLAGFPPTLGFFAKYYLFLKAVNAGFTWLVVIAVINSAMAIYYYLKPVVVMYLRDDKGRAPSKEYTKTHPVSYAVVAVVFLCVLVVAFFGIFPADLLNLILHSV